MAGEAKVTKKIIDEAADILKTVPENKLDDVAAKLGVDTDFVKQSIKNPKTKQAKEFFTTSLKKVGESLEGMQKFVDQTLGRAKEEAVELGTKRDLSMGGQPPAVGKKFKVDFTERPTPGTGKGFTSTPGVSDRGGPLVPVKPPEEIPVLIPEVVSPRMNNLNQKLLTPGVQDAERVSTGLVPGGQIRSGMSEEELADLASKAKPGTPGQGVTERMTRNRPSLGDEFNASMGFDEVTGAPISKVPKKAAGLGAAATAGAAVLASAGFSKEAKAPVVVTEAAVDKVDDLVPLVEKAKQNVEPGKQAALLAQAQQLQAAAQSIEAKLTSDYEKKQARVELMKLAETVIGGLVTAIGANALLNRNSPFAVDFSQGPKTDWNSQFDRLQKDYATQMGLITQKYKIEAAEKRAQAAEAGREARFQQELGLKREELGIKEQKVATEAARKAAEKEAASKDKAFAELSGALASLKEKSTPMSNKQVVANATKLGIPKEEIDLLVSKTTGKGLFNLADEEQVSGILEKYRPGQAAPAAAAPASDLEAKRKRMQELLAKQKGG